jgi:MFS family permease
MSYFGGVLGTALGGYLISLLGSRNACWLGAFLCTSFFLSMSFMNNVYLFAAAFFMFGLCMSIMDVSMNSSGVLAETVHGQPIMGSFHGSYSISSAVGGLVGSSLTSSGLQAKEVFLYCGLAFVASTFVGSLGLYDSSEEKMIERSGRIQSMEHSRDLLAEIEESGGRFALPSGPVPFLAIIGFLGAFGETAMVSWCIIYYKSDLNASSIASSVGFSVFMVCMGLGRFLCDRVRLLVGRQKLMFFAGILASGGMLTLVFASLLEVHMLVLVVASIGCAVAGAGLSTIIPTMFSSAGRLPGHRAGTTIATVAFLSYLGSMVSPFFVGSVSDAISSLRWALFIDAALLIGVTLFAYQIPPEDAAGEAERKRSSPIDSSSAQPLLLESDETSSLIEHSNSAAI